MRSVRRCLSGAACSTGLPRPNAKPVVHPAITMVKHSMKKYHPQRTRAVCGTPHYTLRGAHSVLKLVLLFDMLKVSF